MSPGHWQAPGYGARSDSKEATVEAIYAAGHFLLGRERAAEAAKVFRLLLRVAPRDERGWLGLGECHERAAQLHVAIELYGAGSVVTGQSGGSPVRCLLARARALSKLGRDVDAALAAAHACAKDLEDDDLIALVASERRRLS